MRLLNNQTMALVVALTFSPFVAGQQSPSSPSAQLHQFSLAPAAPQVPPQGERNPGSLSTSPGYALAAEAKAADTQEGNQKYARRLTEWFVPRKAGDAYVDAFSGRLSKADLMARRDERGWIPESVVVQAFNDLMEQTSGKSGKPLRTDTNVVHQLRLTISEVSPVLSAVKSNSSECLPTEAVSLLIQLLYRNGSLEDPCPPKPGPDGALAHQACDGPNATILMFRYCRSHSASDDEKLFDHVAKLFGM
jgi:hypothetical protein